MYLEPLGVMLLYGWVAVFVVVFSLGSSSKCLNKGAGVRHLENDPDPAKATRELWTTLESFGSTCSAAVGKRQVAKGEPPSIKKSAIEGEAEMQSFQPEILRYFNPTYASRAPAD